MRFQSLACVLLLAWACGDKDTEGDPPDAPDTAAPTIVSSSPAAGAIGVNLNATIEVVFSESLDAGTVTSATVALARDGWPAVGVVAYDDATHAVTFDPYGVLLVGRRTYELTLSGIADTAGNVMADTVLSFTTVVNPNFRYIGYSAGVINSYHDAAFDADGRETENVYFDGPGTDANWFNADDDVTYYYLFTYDGALLEWSRATRYTDPGTDGIWRTADDVPDRYEEQTFDIDGNRTGRFVYNGAGTDSTWFTADDEVESGYAYTFVDGLQYRSITYADPGVDGSYGTADDILSNWYDRTYDTEGRLVRLINYRDAGVDGLWLTADDVVDTYDEWSYGEHGLDVQIYFNGSGADSTWFTADDDVTSYNAYSYTADGVQLERVDYDGPGPDGVWQTADDDVSRRNTYDAGGRFAGFVSYNGPGADATWYTADDDIANYRENEFDDCCLIWVRHFNGPGADSTWFTADDGVQYWTEHTSDANGNRVMETSYGGAGTDGVWFTADDVKSNTREYDPSF